MGRYGVTLDEMKESTRAFFKNQRGPVRNKEQGNTISNIQQPEKQVETPSQPPSSSFQTRTREFDVGLFLILTTITGVFLYLFSADVRLMTHQLVEKGIGRLNLLSQESLMIGGIVVIVCIIALVSRRSR